MSSKDNKTKGNFYSTYESRKNLDLFSFSITARDTPKRTSMTTSKFETKEVLKIDQGSSRSLRRMWPFHVVLFKERQRNE